MKHPLIIGVLIALLLLTLSACRTQSYVQPHATNHTADTIELVKHQRDSVFLHDSVYIREKGDTVLMERWHTQFKYKYIYRDSVEVHVRVDSIPFPVEVEKRVAYVPKLVQALAGLGAVVLLVLVGMLIARVSRFIN